MQLPSLRTLFFSATAVRTLKPVGESRTAASSLENDPKFHLHEALRPSIVVTQRNFKPALVPLPPALICTYRTTPAYFVMDMHLNSCVQYLHL